jgi:hypothetical protein
LLSLYLYFFEGLSYINTKNALQRFVYNPCFYLEADAEIQTDKFFERNILITEKFISSLKIRMTKSLSQQMIGYVILKHVNI